MYIESTNTDKTEFAIHCDIQCIEEIYEGLIFLYNLEKGEEKKKHIARQILAMQKEVPTISF